MLRIIIVVIAIVIVTVIIAIKTFKIMLVIIVTVNAGKLPAKLPHGCHRWLLPPTVSKLMVLPQTRGSFESGLQELFRV